MTVTYINGRIATEDEARAVAHGYDCARARDLKLLAGLLPPPEDEGHARPAPLLRAPGQVPGRAWRQRPVADLDWGV